MLAYRLYLSFAPWVVFDLFCRVGGPGALWGSSAALATAIACCAIARRRGTMTNLHVGAVGIFLALLTGAAVANGHVMHEYGRPLAAAGFVLFDLATLSFSPVTEPYLRYVLPIGIQDDPLYRRTNIRLSLLWAGLFVGIMLAHLLGNAVPTEVVSTLGNWILPLVFGVIGCVVTEHMLASDFDADSAAIGDRWDLVERPSTTTPHVPARPRLRLVGDRRAEAAD
jgi:hypothetical protein